MPDRLSVSSNDDMAVLVRENLVWDSHAGIFPDPDADLDGVTQWLDDGVNYVSLNIGFDVLSWEASVQTLVAYRRRLQAMADKIIVIRTTADILQARAKGKLAVSFDIEGANALNDDLGMVSAYHDLGVRQMLLAYNLNNAAAGGCHDDDMGLTEFGSEIVEEMNRVGMIVDCSHAGYRTTIDMIERSATPAVFTHSNPVALCAHQRNILDDQIKLCAEKGGVVGINGMGIFLGENTVDDSVFADHACYVADLVGPDHVGVGLDYKPPSKTAPNLGEVLRSRPDYWPAGQRYDTPSIKLVSPQQLPGICTILAKRGWSKADLTGFLGGNFMRVAVEAWSA